MTRPKLVVARTPIPQASAASEDAGNTTQAASARMAHVPRDMFRAAADGTKAEMLYVIRGENDDPRPPPLKEIDIAKIRAWIERGGDVNGEPGPPFELESTVFEGEIIYVLYPGARLLTVAAECGRVDVMRLLIAAGADVNHVTRVPIGSVPENFRYDLTVYRKGSSALMAAAVRNQEGAVRLLIEHGADVNFATDDNWGSVINFSLENPHILKMVLVAGADMNWTQADDGSGIPSCSMEYLAQLKLNLLASRVNSMVDTETNITRYRRAVRDRDWCQESVEILERLRLAEWPILSVSRPFKEFPPFRILLWNRVFGSNKAGLRTTEAVARFFGRNKTGVLADLPDGVFWLIVQFFVAGEMRPHVTPVAST